MLGLRPGDVRGEALDAGYVEPCADPADLFYPSLRAHAPSGTVGDARAAAGARAERYLGAWVDVLAEAYRGEKNSA
jgi:hypothetical protein